MVSVDHFETPPGYLNSPRPVRPQELPAQHGAYMYNQQQWPMPQATTNQHDPLMGRSYPNSHETSQHDDNKERRRICGMSPLIFVLVLLSVILIAVGAIVGGVLGSRSTKEKNVE